MSIVEKLTMNLQFFAAGDGPPSNTTGTLNTGTGSVATKPAAFYDKTLLVVRRQKQFYHRRLAQSKPMPKRTGDTINFRKITKLAPKTTPVTEGVTPAGSQGSVEAISATTRYYGDWMGFTDVVDFEQVDDVLTAYTTEQGYQANESLDEVTRDELAGGTNVFYEGGKTSRAALAAGDIPTIETFRKAVLQMKNNYIRPAMNGKYVAIISPGVAFDLMDDPDFGKAYDQSRTGTPYIKGQVADLFGIMFAEQVNAKVFDGAGATGENVHASILLGYQAYGETTIKGQGNIKSVIKGLGSSGTEDPLSQRQTIGWKVPAFVAKRLDELAIARLESVPTNN